MLRTAVIGTGNMGENHVRVYDELEDAELVAIAEISKKGGELAKKYGCRHYRGYQEMIDSEDLDAISICVPTSIHSEVALACIEKGIHILVEKPIASTIEEGEEIQRKAAEKGVILTVGHIERFNPAVQRLKDIIDKKIGSPTSIIARRVGIFPPQIKEANVITDLAVHDIDIFNYLLGKSPKEIYAKSGMALERGREDHAIIILSYENTDCLIQVNWITPVKVRELAVTGTKGYAELNYITQDLRVFENTFEKSHDTFGDFVLKFGNPKEVTINVSKMEPLTAELKHFLDCVENGKTPIVTGADGLSALHIATKAIESYRKGKPLKLE
jgi:UDP-N-acetylglucosamine 3-dehydrogenase